MRGMNNILVLFIAVSVTVSVFSIIDNLRMKHTKQEYLFERQQIHHPQQPQQHQKEDYQPQQYQEDRHAKQQQRYEQRQQFEQPQRPQLPQDDQDPILRLLKEFHKLEGGVELLGKLSQQEKVLEKLLQVDKVLEKLTLERLSHQDKMLERQSQQTTTKKDLPTIYVVTPTYKRLEQIPELTRLAQTLMNVPNIHWIVAEDTNTTNTRVVEYLKYTGLPYTYLLTPMPQKYNDPNYKGKGKPKGVANRNAAIDWICNHATEGVMYLADDDNTYDIRIFEEMRYTKKVSMFPVGLVTQAGLSTPVLKEGKYYAWYDGWIGGRKFPVDMAGFAVSVPFLLTVPEAMMPYTPGYEETGFLSSLKIKPEEMEFKANNCTKIYVWHTKTHKNSPSSRNILNKLYDGTNLRLLQKLMTLKEEPTTKRPPTTTRAPRPPPKS